MQTLYLKIKIIFLSVTLLSAVGLRGQVRDFDAYSNNNLINFVNSLRDKKLNNSEILKQISTFNHYPTRDKLLADSIYYIQDSVYNKIPFKIFIPKIYDGSKPTGLVLLLHGAVTISKFEDAFTPNKESQVDDDIFGKALRSIGYIIAMPYGDRPSNFDWAVSPFGEGKNPTYNSLLNLVKHLKLTLNIDDNKVFSYGHSDGSDGAFMLEVYKPTEFAGFVAYNSMLLSIFTYNIYLKNTLNKPLYLVHSDLDDLRPIQQTRVIVHALDSIGAPVNYREYYGYQHFDAHLKKDFSRSVAFLNNTIRNPYPDTVYWETNDHDNASMDWIRILNWNFDQAPALWHKPINFRSYSKKEKKFIDRPYYNNMAASAAINGTYKNNVFKINTSRVTKFEILINPNMVDLSKEILVELNGKRVFMGKVSADNTYTLNAFSLNHDRKMLWVNSIVIDVKNN